MVPANRATYLGPDLDSRVQVCSFPFSRFYRPLRQARECWELTQRVRRLDPDVVHLQQGHHVLNLLLGRLRRYPLVVTIHEPSEHRRPRHGPRRPPQFALNLGFRRANGVIVHGEALRPGVAGRGVDPAVIHRIPRPVPRVSGAADGEDFPTVLFFGRIWPYKGLEYLIQAEPLIAARVPTVRTVIAGEGEDLSRYRSLMANPERFDVQNHFVSREQRSELFARASVVVLPYVDASTSAVIPIAYLHQKPVVVTSVGGLAEDVDAGRTGLVVPPRDHVALAEALTRLLRDPGLRHELGRAGRRKLDMECAPDLVARRTLHVYALAQDAAAASARRRAWSTPWPGQGGQRAREHQNL
jgi:glycosyltransferase involved in cell wall biosynthesis